MTGRVLHTGQVIIDIAIRVDAVPEPGGDVFGDYAGMHVGGGCGPCESYGHLVTMPACTWEAATTSCTPLARPAPKPCTREPWGRDPSPTSRRTASG